MGKKDEEIERLRKELKIEKSGCAALSSNYEKLKAEKAELEKTIEEQSKGFMEQTQSMKQNYDHSVKEMQAKVQKMKDHKETLLLSVQIVGGETPESITELLNSSSAMLKTRLTALGIADRYDILAIPSTFGIGTLR